MNLRFAGIYSVNSVNYLLADFACLLMGISIVPIYDTLGDQAISYIIE